MIFVLRGLREFDAARPHTKVPARAATGAVPANPLA